MKKTKEELDFASRNINKYHQALKRVKINIQGDDTNYIGMIVERIIGQVEADDANSEWDKLSYKVPIKIKFKIKDTTNKDNGKIVEIDVFSIKNISFFD